VRAVFFVGVLLGFALGFAGCASQVRPASDTEPTVPFAIYNPPPVLIGPRLGSVGDKTFEQTQVGGLVFLLSTDCEVTIRRPNRPKVVWQAPLAGGCAFVRDTTDKGSVKLFANIKNRKYKPGAPLMIMIGSSVTSIKPGRRLPADCNSSTLGLLIENGNVIAQNPPYNTFARCLHAPVTVDEINFSFAWESIGSDRKPNRLTENKR
jgi:hypothetical protein